MTRPPNPSKAAAVAGLVTAIVSSAEHARTPETPFGAHLTLEYHEAAQREAEEAAAADEARGIDEGMQTWDALGGSEW